MKNAKVLVPTILLLIGLGAGFLGGMQFKNYQIGKSRGNFQRFTGDKTVGQNGTMMRGGAITGSILSMDDKSVTVKLLDGSSKIILFSTSTTYSNTITGAKTDLKVGENVAVIGAANSDGSVTATSIQINPEFGRPR
jgi:hypothetical protein